MVARMARIGLVPGQDFVPSKLDFLSEFGVRLAAARKPGYDSGRERCSPSSKFLTLSGVRDARLLSEVLGLFVRALFAFQLQTGKPL